MEFVNIFIRYRSKQRTSELPVATKMVPTTPFSRKEIIFAERKSQYVNFCSNPTLSIQFKVNKGFFSCCSLTRLVNMG